MPLSEQAINTAVSILKRGRESPPIPIDDLPEECRPRSVEEAMQMQDALNAVLSTTELGLVVGSKIGCTTKVMQDYLGMSHPCDGAIFGSTIFQRFGQPRFDSYSHVGVECEIAVTLSEAIEPTDKTHTLHSVSDSVGSVHAAIEIVDDRYVDFESRRPDWPTWVADNFFGAGAVLGDPLTDWRSLDLASIQGTMRINGGVVGRGFGRDIINGHPLEALVWLANECSRRSRRIPAGWIVLLGSVVQTKWVSRGDIIEVELEGLGTARAEF